MNKLTQDFHTEKFPGFVPDFSYEQCIDQLWKSKTIPCIDTKIDLSVDKTHEWLVEHDHLFVNHYTSKDLDEHIKKENAGWYTSPNKSGWYSIGVFGEDFKNVGVFSGGNPLVFETKQKKYPEAVPDLIKQFNLHNLPVYRLHILRLAPGGWLAPHLDKKIKGSPILTHGWIALNDSNSSLKIYPTGNIPHKTGRMYLFNNVNFLHSVVNSDTKPRYAALFKIDENNLSTTLWNHLQQMVKEQWFTDLEDN